MVNLKLTVFKKTSDIIWLTGFLIVLSISFFVSDKFFTAIYMLRINKYIAFSTSILIFIMTYMTVCGLLFRLCVPKLKEGHYGTDSKQYLLWRLNWNFYSYIFLFARYFVLYLPFTRYLVLRLFRVNLKPSVYIAETANFQDCNNLITIGENSGIGSEVLLSTHLALSPTTSIQKRLTIGNNTHIQARACLAPGVSIGNNSIIGFGSMLSTGAKVGNNVKTGTNVLIGTNCVVGNNCKLGHCVIISDGLKIADDTIIPDFTNIIRLKGIDCKETVIDNNNIKRYVNMAKA